MQARTIGEMLRAVEKKCEVCVTIISRSSPPAGLLTFFQKIFMPMQVILLSLDRPALTVMGDNHVSRVLSNAMPSHPVSHSPIQYCTAAHACKKERAIVRSEAGNATMGGNHLRYRCTPRNPSTFDIWVSPGRGTRMESCIIYFWTGWTLWNPRAE